MPLERPTRELMPLPMKQTTGFLLLLVLMLVGTVSLALAFYDAVLAPSDDALRMYRTE